MATGNFIDGEYGIFALLTITEEEAAEQLQDIGEEATAENVANEIRMYEEFMLQDFSDILRDALQLRGVTMYEERDGFTCYDEEDRIVARLQMSPGYYSGAQVLVEGDPQELLRDYYDEQAYLEDYSPDITPVLEALREVTTELQVFARFSNGETWYTKAEEVEE